MDRPWNLIKKNPSLAPLFFVVGLGAVGSVLYVARVGLRNPEIVLVKKDKEPWDDWRNKQYKFYSPGMEEKDHVCKAPVY